MGIEIAFYDVETTVPFEQGQNYELLEFAAVVVSMPSLSENSCYSTLIRPSSDWMTTHTNFARNGIITQAALADAPTFSQVADSIYTMLNGRVWAGHNIVRFDNIRLKEAFSQIGKPAPEAAGMIDTLPMLTEKFGPRAGNMKIASLASFFGLGQQEHRSLSDVRMNLEVLRKCATLLFLESCFPEIFVDSQRATFLRASPTVSESFWEAKDIVLASVTAEVEQPSRWGGWKIVLLHQGLPLRICESRMRVRFSLNNSLFAFDRAGNPTFVIAVEPSAQACNIISFCESLAKRRVGLGGISTWRPPLLKWGGGGLHFIRIRIKTMGSGDGAIYSTRFYRKDLSTGGLFEISLGQVDAYVFKGFIQPGCLIDVGFLCDVYNYCGCAGLRFVAEKIIL